MAQIDVNELRKLFGENIKKRQKADFARKIAKEEEKQKIKEATAKPLTRQQRMEAEVKKLKTQDELNKLTGRGKAESGADAVDRLLKAMKDQRNLMYDKDGEPVFSGKMEEKTTLRGRRSIPIPGTDRVIPIPGMSREIEIDTPGFDPRGRKGSNFRIAQERMEELQKDLQTAQKAKEQGITMQEAKRNRDVQKKYEEFLKIFDRPGVDRRRSDYLARLSTQSFFRK
jgi:phage-related minor tail protein|tara:strand:- start:7704 stop:8384 length:681 start_codon:yes stop_codon:yes gene_type:complete